MSPLAVLSPKFYKSLHNYLWYVLSRQDLLFRAYFEFTYFMIMTSEISKILVACS